MITIANRRSLAIGMCLLLWGVLFLAACNTNNTSLARADLITCTVAYRASTSQPIEHEESLALIDSDAEQSVAFNDLVFHAAYRTGEADNERSLRLWVTDVNDSTIYQSQLYQLDPVAGPQNQFQGGHGFTGLNYSYHPTSQAEMQFWCEATSANKS
jgi:hypothetical protein